MKELEKIKKNIKEIKGELKNQQNIAEMNLKNLAQGNNNVFAQLMKINEKMKIVDSMTDVNMILLNHEQQFSRLFADFRRLTELTDKQYLQLTQTLKNNNRMITEWTTKIDQRLTEIENKISGEQK